MYRIIILVISLFILFSGCIQEEHSAVYWFNRGVELMDSDCTKAIAYFDKSLDRDPNGISSWYNKGVCLYRLGRHTEALNATTTAIGIYPNDSYAWHVKGLILYELENYTGSLESFNTAIDIGLNDRQIWSDKCYVLYKLGQYQEAIKACDKALDVDPTFVNAWLNKGLTLYELGRYQEALKAYEKALEINPDSQFARECRDKVLEEIRERNESMVGSAQ